MSLQICMPRRSYLYMMLSTHIQLPDSKYSTGEDRDAFPESNYTVGEDKSPNVHTRQVKAWQERPKKQRFGLHRMQHIYHSSILVRKGLLLYSVTPADKCQSKSQDIPIINISRVSQSCSVSL